MGELDRQEKTLVACLLGKSLRGNLGWTGEELTQSLTLADQVERIVGRQPWAEVNRALLDIRVNCKYVSAAKRLARDDVRQEPLAPALYRAARILAGTPQRDAGSGLIGCFAVIESAVTWLLKDNSGRLAINRPELVRRLELAVRRTLVHTYSRFENGRRRPAVCYQQGDTRTGTAATCRAMDSAKSCTCLGEMALCPQSIAGHGGLCGRVVLAVEGRYHANFGLVV